MRGYADKTRKLRGFLKVRRGRNERAKIQLIADWEAITAVFLAILSIHFTFKKVFLSRCKYTVNPRFWSWSRVFWNNLDSGMGLAADQN